MVKKSSAAVPRVLFWLSRTGTAMQQAFAEKIVKQALDVDSIYSVIRGHGGRVHEPGSDGDFNTTVLYEPAELLDQYDWLMARIARGHGLVIIGSDNRARMIAENFGFKYGESLTTTGAMLQLTDDSGWAYRYPCPSAAGSCRRKR